LWLSRLNRKGYGEFQIGTNQKGMVVLAHRFSYYAKFGPTQLFVLHTCDNPACVNPKHLFTGTNRDNMRDCATKGRTARGARHGNVVLTESIVKRIVRMAASLNPSRIAKRLGLKRQTVNGVVKGYKWSWLTGIKRNGTR
jgi:hypothetical protein